METPALRWNAVPVCPRVKSSQGVGRTGRSRGRLYADALVNDKSEVSKLVDLYALIARMKILSSDAVIEAAEKAGRLILETYLSPNKTFVDLPDLINEMDPLRDFSEACRRELQSADRR